MITQTWKNMNVAAGGDEGQSMKLFYDAPKKKAPLY